MQKFFLFLSIYCFPNIPGQEPEHATAITAGPGDSIDATNPSDEKVNFK
jgi:hypothetical protein